MQGEDNRSGIRVCVPHRAARLGSARLGSARLGSARLGVKPGNRYASRNSLGRRCSKVIHERSRVPPVPPERFPLRNDDAHPLTTHANHPHKSTKSPYSVAFASSRTLDELMVLQRALGVVGPCIAEDGAVLALDAAHVADARLAHLPAHEVRSYGRRTMRDTSAASSPSFAAARSHANIIGRNA